MGSAEATYWLHPAAQVDQAGRPSVSVSSRSGAPAPFRVPSLGFLTIWWPQGSQTSYTAPGSKRVCHKQQKWKVQISLDLALEVTRCHFSWW